VLGEGDTATPPAWSQLREGGGEFAGSLLLYLRRWRQLAIAAPRCMAAKQWRVRWGVQKGEQLALRFNWAPEEDKSGR
jgi:hypothetical protein